MYNFIAKKIGDTRCLWLIKEIIKSSYENIIYQDLLTVRYAGIPIGNLTSQLFANIYLNELDKFVKHKLCKRYYVRYMDDFLILGDDKKSLHLVMEQIRVFLWDILRLTMHPKKATVFPAEQSINFLGYRVFRRHRLLRKSTVKRFVRRTKRNEQLLEKGQIDEECRDAALRSWIAYAEHGNSWRLREKLEQELGVILNDVHPDVLPV